MSSSWMQTYEPLNQLKLLADNLWMVDGPIIKMDFPLGFKMPFPTRMVLVRLPNGDLWVHSPTEPTDDLFAQIDALGPVRHLVAPNSIHYWYLPYWTERYPDARTYGVEGLTDTAKREIRIDETLSETTPADWQDMFDTIIFSGSVIAEAVFLHRPSRTLLLTDLIENFEPDKIRGGWRRWFLGLVGIVDPDGKMPLDLRMTFWGKSEVLTQQVHQMIDWQPDRVIMAHGRPYLNNGTAELRRAFRWVKGVS
ncbi:MAG: DUF4336 domain-containing protein [Pseudomonadota bacterium]